MRRFGLQFLAVLLGVALGASIGIVAGNALSPNGAASHTPNDSRAVTQKPLANTPANSQDSLDTTYQAETTSKVRSTNSVVTPRQSTSVAANASAGSPLAISALASSSVVQVSRSIPAMLFVGVCGDQNGDSLVNVFDAIIELQIIVGKVDPTRIQEIFGDVVRDGTINVFDVILTLQAIVGKVPTIEECGPPTSE